MFRIFRFLNGGGRELLSDADLQQREKNDKYKRSKRLSDFAVGVFFLLIIGIGIVVVTQYVSDPSFKAFIMDEIKQNFTGIIFTILALAGVKYIKD